MVDKDGNAVAVTYTLNTTFGTGIVAGNSGILLNNQMDDFSAKPGVPNVYGLVGGDANAVGPKKRPLSSMSPTIVVKDGKTWLVTGSPGGSRIITTVLQMVVNSIDYGMNVAEATNAPRFHHLSQLYGYLAKQFTIFGQHVHIGCPDPDQALWLLHAFNRYIPHLIALSAASPFGQGIDSRFQSARLNSVFAFPLSGRAPFVLIWDDFSGYYRKMIASGVVKSMKGF